MNFLIIDGNSIVNRAFYGIKLLTAKDGHYTNAIYGFMNTFLHLINTVSPECVAVAFDVKQPTFRHEMYNAYKAGRKGMPAELYEQMAPLKEMLVAYGCHIVECPGYEADDILGTLAEKCGEGNHAYIATGDRDSLQLVRKNVSVLLITTKNQVTQTVEYTPEKLMDEYGLTPEEMIELKALQGDNSDNIPGVPGIGPKTAGELIKKYHSIDNIYENINELDASKGVIAKLIAGKESAELSRKLGTICLNAPIDTDIYHYVLLLMNENRLKQEFVRHEMFKFIEKFNLQNVQSVTKGDIHEQQSLTKSVNYIDVDEAEHLLQNVEAFSFYLKKSAVEDRYIVGLAVKDNLSFLRLDYDDFAYFFRFVSELTAEKCVYSSKEIYKIADKMGIEFKQIVFDICLSVYLLNPNVSDLSLLNTALAYGIHPMNIVSETATLSEEEAQFAKELSFFPLLWARLRAKSEACAQIMLLTKIEIPLAEVLAGMENTGIAVKKEQIKQQNVVLGEKIALLEKSIYSLVGHEFNINSPKQLGIVLFEEMGIPAKKKTKTGYSTNAEVLEELASQYEIVAKILEYRTFAKLKSTYCEGLLKAIEPDGRIRSTFNQTETRTGRLSSTEPNLQNIPVRTREGREFRKFFCAKDGCLLVDADYSQIELRVLAHMANDKNMIAAFSQQTDIHTLTASKVFNLPVEQVTPELRSRSKAVNFGIIYGIGAFSLAKDIHTSRKEAEAFINSYLSLYSGVGAYFDNCITQAKQNGYVTTLFNRRRYLPELTNSNRMIAAFGERVARNMPIQGTSADIIKIAMIRVAKRLKEELPDTKLIMQVHDELILEAPENEAQKAGEILKEEMENAVKLSVNLIADVGIGKTWYEAKNG